MPARNRPAGVPHPPSGRFTFTELAVRRSTLVVDEESAGGLVVKVRDGVPYVAVIARRNRHRRIEWCLPKGHVEPGESLEVAAQREIAEETGILGQVVTPLASIDYWFTNVSQRIHKVVHHFLFEYVDGVITVENDPDHEAEYAEWVPLSSVTHRLEFPNERRVVSIALALLYPGRRQ